MRAYKMVDVQTTNVPRFIFRTERKVLLLCLVLLILAEVGLRLVERQLSGNVRHIRDLPYAAEELKRSHGASFLILGNSLIDNAVDSRSFVNALVAKGVNPVVAIKAIPDGSNIWDWYFLYKRYFLGDGAAPTVIVNGFAWGFLSDQIRPNPSKLAAFFAGFNDLPELISLGMTDVGDIVEFGLAKWSRTYAYRDLIRNRVLDFFIPNYRQYTQKLNAASNATGTSSNGRASIQTYRILHSFAEAARAGNSKLVLVAMPVVVPYRLDSHLLTTAKSLGIELLDHRHLSFLNEQSYVDPIHLGSEAGSRFGAYLADELIEDGLLKSLKSNQPEVRGAVRTVLSCCAPGQRGHGIQ